MKAKIKTAISFSAACLPAVVYVLWLNAYYWLLKGGRYKAFVQPKLWPLLILALLLLAAFIAASIFRFSSKSRIAFKFDAVVNAAVLIVPVFFLWSVYGSSLGTDAFAKKALNPGQIIVKGEANIFRYKPSAGAAGDQAISLLDLLADSERFDGKRVATEGMIYRGASAGKNAFTLFRFAVICCAAEAIPLAVTVNSTEAKIFDNDSWVKVEGLFKIEAVGGRQVATIAAESILPIPKPPAEKRYLFF